MIDTIRMTAVLQWAGRVGTREPKLRTRLLDGDQWLGWAGLGCCHHACILVMVSGLGWAGLGWAGLGWTGDRWTKYV